MSGGGILCCFHYRWPLPATRRVPKDSGNTNLRRYELMQCNIIRCKPNQLQELPRLMQNVVTLTAQLSEYGLRQVLSAFSYSIGRRIRWSDRDTWCASDPAGSHPDPDKRIQ